MNAEPARARQSVTGAIVGEGGREEGGAPLSAPKHETATMRAKAAPPTGPKSARPKSSATVLLRASVSCPKCAASAHRWAASLRTTARTFSSTTKYDRFARKNRIYAAPQLSRTRVHRERGGKETYDDDAHTAMNSPWNIPSRIAHLPTNVIRLVPPIKRPQARV